MELAPVVEEKVPATQLVHEDAALADQVPAAHVKQALIAVLPELALYVPCAVGKVWVRVKRSEFKSG